MKRMTLALATVGATLALGVVAPLSAYAATGPFTYTQPDGTQQQLEDPADDTCHAIRGQGYTRNDTDRDAQLYTGSDCTVEAGYLPAGAEEPDATSPRSYSSAKPT